jgi:CO dehydrogenase maturation factor
MTLTRQSDHPLRRRRILVCGKGGSGKSTLVALLATVLQQKGYAVIVLDGDASNPEGLVRLMFGTGVEGEPKPLVEFFGGLARVTCPVDDPSPLTRVGDSNPVPSDRINIDREIQSDYYLRRENITLFQTGKIERYGQGCDGPLEKVVRDFMVEGDAVNLIDMKAGVEHFGRRIPDQMDIILEVMDYTLESVSISKRVAEFCDEADIKDYWFILNKVGSEDIESLLMDKLGKLKDRVIGKVPFDQELIKSGLTGKALGECSALEHVAAIVERLEQRLCLQNEAC